MSPLTASVQIRAGTQDSGSFGALLQPPHHRHQSAVPPLSRTQLPTLRESARAALLPLWRQCSPVAPVFPCGASAATACCPAASVHVEGVTGDFEVAWLTGRPKWAQLIILFACTRGSITQALQLYLTLRVADRWALTFAPHYLIFSVLLLPCERILFGQCDQLTVIG